MVLYGSILSGALVAGPNGSGVFGRYVPLNILWRCTSGSDSFTSTNMTEAGNYSLSGQVAYIPANPISGISNAAFYRLRKGGDHMDSVSTNEGGYALEQALGYPLASANALAGLTPITRWRNTSNGDHATLDHIDSLPGYVKEGALGRYGFARYDDMSEVLIRCPSAGTAGGVAVESNAVAGGSIWQWYWNGTSFINHSDLGRQMQTSIAQGLNADGTTSPQALTEAGDKYPLYSNPSFAHGAPCSELRNMSGVSGQVSRGIPLEWHALNGGPQQPSLDIDAVLGKDIYLNYMMPDGINRNWPVAKYVAYVKIPNTAQVRAAEIPTVYLPGNFNRFYTYDAGLPGQPGTLTEVTAQMPDGTVNPGWAKYFAPASKYGGVIVSDATGAKAMGMYAAMTTAPYPGCATMFGLWKFINPNGPHSTTSASCVKMSVWRGINAANQGTATINAGVNQYNSWVMTDTVANIAQYMDMLRSQAAQGVR